MPTVTKSRFGPVLLAAGAVVAGTLALAPSADAAGGSCSGRGPTVDGHETVYCDTYVTAGVTQGSTPYEGDSREVGILYAGHNWFVCQIKGRDNPVIQGAQNNWWLQTLADVVTRPGASGWGSFPATAVVQGNAWEPVPGVPIC
ncbi:hypothetical protein [Streptomyces sp. NBC_01451]|uniref:hypothetical protein n=1 Tax=Streptomyces sp. NBC_01451 TaxID=2903872 RepID=UPI002E33443D|nr:hypothetical protein [Streptomyces sp. NBC_01451]